MYVREAIPIQEEEERASVKSAVKARPILKPSSTSKLDFIPDIEVQRSKDRYCFLMSKFITQLFLHNEVGRKEDVGVFHDRIVEKCMEVPPDDSRYWPDEIEEKRAWTRISQRTSGQTFCQQVEDRRKGFNTV